MVRSVLPSDRLGGAREMDPLKIRNISGVRYENYQREIRAAIGAAPGFAGVLMQASVSLVEAGTRDAILRAGFPRFLVRYLHRRSAGVP